MVVKIGGSLLSEPGAMARVAEWLEATRLPGQVRVLIPGGGRAVEALREVDRANPVTEAASHGAAIGIMDLHADLLGDWLAGVRVTETPPNRSGDWALKCRDWLRDAEPLAPGERLAVGWRTTSDSIAARVAELMGARLVLLKHTLASPCGSLDEAAAQGVVDPELPRHASSLAEVRLIGLGGTDPPEEPRAAQPEVCAKPPTQLWVFRSEMLDGAR